MKLPRVPRAPSPATEDETEAESAADAESEAAVAEAPASATTPAPPLEAPAMRSSPATMTGDYTLSGIPRQSEREYQSSPNSIPRANFRRGVPASAPAPPPRANVTQIMPRAAGPLTDTKLKGLRVLLIGSEEKLVDFERVSLEGSGAEVVVESNWSKAIDRMTSAGVHAIVLNEGGGDQTRRIYQAVESQYPGWMKRLLLVLAQDDIPTQHFIATCQAKCLMQPFPSAELVNTLGSMFGRNGASVR